jgi:hypothetical protein
MTPSRGRGENHVPASRISVLIALVAWGGKVPAIDPEAQRNLRAMPLARAPSFALIAP